MLWFGQSLFGLCNFVGPVRILFFGQSLLDLCNFVAPVRILCICLRLGGFRQFLLRR